MSANPAIYVTQPDFDRLLPFASDDTKRGVGPSLLGLELERAILVQPDSRRHFVRLGSTVTYEDTRTGRLRTVQLSLPTEADIDRGRVSIVSPVGAALLGLQRGKEFTWTGGDSRPHAIRVIALD